MKCWHFKLRATEYVVVTPPIDSLTQQLLVLLLISFFKGRLICQIIHFKVKIINEIIKISLELYHQLYFLLKFQLFIL